MKISAQNNSSALLIGRGTPINIFFKQEFFQRCKKSDTYSVETKMKQFFKVLGKKAPLYHFTFPSRNKDQPTNEAAISSPTPEVTFHPQLILPL